MRIKNLKVKNIYGDGKKWNVSFTQKENIILIRQPNDENSFMLFTTDFLEIVDCLFFNDSYAYAKNMLSKNSLIECKMEKDGVDYTFGAKGNHSKTKKDGKVWVQNVLDWYCIVPEKELEGRNGGWLGAQLSCEAQEYFYPYALRDFSTFYKDTCADSPTNFAYGEELNWLNLQAHYNKRQVDVEKKLQKIVEDFQAITINEHLSVGLNKQKEYVLLFDGRIVSEKTLNEREERLVNFCGWINNLNVLTDLCEFVAESGVYPVFVDNVLDGVLSEYKEVLIKELRKTGRQVFIISHKHDENVEKYCDKVVEISLE